MACTPRKLVHWSTDNEVNEFVYGSPYSDASSDSVNATSTLQYINSQLIAHGFAKGPGISVEGLGKDDIERLSKCLLGMLSQRVEDMSRAEDLSTKLRTMSYEHERLMSMHRTTEEQLASSERETNLYKSRLSAANKSIQAAEAAYKASTADLQRTRTSLQSVRQTHAAELKRKEKETEKLLERWQKISDAQTKLGTSASGLVFKQTHVNPLTDSRDSDGIGPRGSDLLEDALEEAQSARKELIEENTSLKNVVLSAANEINRMARSIRMRVDACSEGSAQQKLTFSDLFSIPAPESASDRFAELLASFHDAINQIGNDDVDQIPISAQIQSPSNIQKPKDENKEIQRLQNTIVDLRRQLEQAQTQKQTNAYSDQAQDIIRKFVNDDNEKSHVQERRVLEKIRKELDHARKKVDEAALTLRDEKEMLEEERQAFFREQHLWRSRMGIPNDGDEPKPASGLAAYFDAPAEPLDIPVSLASPRSARKPKRAKSPSKPPAGASPRKPVTKNKVRVPGKKSAITAGTTPKKAKAAGRAPALGASPARARVIPPMETEVFASPPPNLLPQLGGGTSAASQSRIVTDTFVLPPPTPLTSIPPEADILASLGQGRSLAPDFGVAPLPSLGGGSSSMEGMGHAKSDETGAGPSTMKTSMSLGKKPFPVAKPFAQHMIHAYSPARPSPLSRILNLAKSPSVTSESDGDFDEDINDGKITLETRMDGEEQEETIHAGPPAMTLDELGIVGGGIDRNNSDNYEDEDSGPIEESPLRDKNIRVANRRKPPIINAAARRGATTAAAVTKEKLRGMRAERDKENGGGITSGTTTLRSGKAKSGKGATGTVPATKPAVTGGGTSKGGARRVPIGSVDAAPIGRAGWK